MRSLIVQTPCFYHLWYLDSGNPCRNDAVGSDTYLILFSYLQQYTFNQCIT